MAAPLTPTQARKHLSAVLTAGGRVLFSGHALREMDKDGLTKADAMGVLRTGRIFEPAELEGESWRYRVHSPRVCVVVTFDGDTVVVVVTAWKKKR